MKEKGMPFQALKQALSDLKEGKMILLLDDPSRENEGDLIFAAEKVSADKIAFMLRHGSGIICLCLTESKVNTLNLPLMVPENLNQSAYRTAFTVSIEASQGVSTGVSAEDRTRTILTAIDAHAKPSDLVRPGHVFPLRALDKGVLARRGHTEGSVDLMQLAGLSAAAVLCEVMNPDGSMSRGQTLEAFAKKHAITTISLQEIVDYRLSQEDFISAVSQPTCLPSEKWGELEILAFKDSLTNQEHLLVRSLQPPLNPLVRIHSSCLTGEIFQSLRCDCGHQLTYALDRIAQEGGFLIYLQQEGRGIGLFNKINAYSLQEQGLDTVEANETLGLPADSREYTIAANILRRLGIDSCRLMTNNQTKLAALQGYAYLTVQREAMPIFHNEHNNRYLKTKQAKLGHFNLDQQD